MIIEVKVKTSARKVQIEKIGERLFRVSINSVRERGKANREVLRVLAEYFDVPVSEFRLKRGATSLTKFIEMSSK